MSGRDHRSRCRLGLVLSLGLALLIGPSLTRAASVEVEIRGVDGAMLDNVRAYLGIVQHQFDTEGRIDPGIVRRLHQRARGEVRQALKPFGYHEPEIDARLEVDEDGNWTASYQIRPGPAIRLVEVSVRVQGAGRDDPRFEHALEQIALAENRRLRHAEYESAKRRLMTVASDRGYLEARWTENVLRIDPELREASVVLVLDSGPRYAFGRVEFQHSILSREFLERYLRFSPGDPFDSDQLLELQFALDDSAYFRRVDVRARRDRAANQRIPLEVELHERPKHRYTFGVGFGTDTGARGSIGRETRYVNDRGHSLAVQAQVAQISTRLSARYTIPLEEPWRERFEFDTSLSQEDIGDGRSDRFEFGGKLVTASGAWQRSLSLRFERSRDEVGDETSTQDLVMPGIGFGRSNFDDSIYATRGYRLAVDLNGGSETLGSDVSFARARVSGSGVHRVWEGGRVIGRAELGRIWTDDFGDLPLSQRFFAGGDQSIRGFDFQELGPENDDGDVIGGEILIVSSIELEQLLFGNWGAAVFVDHGNAVNDLDDRLRTSAGVGLRYRSPIGMLRVDVARPTDGDGSARLHLSLGVNL